LVLHLVLKILLFNPQYQTHLYAENRTEKKTILALYTQFVPNFNLNATQSVIQAIIRRLSAGPSVMSYKQIEWLLLSQCLVVG
jgi:hypothetical protein